MKKLFLSLLVIIATVAANAGPRVKDLIKNSGDAGDYPGKHLLVLFDSTVVDVQETGLSYVNKHQLFKILDAEGAKRKAVIKFGYDPLSAYVEIRGVTIYRKSGETERLDTAKVLDYPAPARAIYWGAREKMIEVGRLEPGDAVEVFIFRKGFTYALLAGTQDSDEKYIPPMKGHFYDIVHFWSSDPVKEMVYRVIIPTGKQLQFKVYNGEVQTSAELTGDKWVYTFTKRDFSQPEREPNMVSPSDEFPKLLLSTSPDWKAKSLWFYKVNEDFGSFESTPEIDDKVREILKNAASEQDSISLLTHWVADNIRYSGISMGKGEGYTLHKGEMTFRDRCGVCKDKAGMLITMLRAAGFESYPAMTMAGSRIDRIPADQFNHSVTVVKHRNGDYELLDPTWVPFVRELWSSLEQQQNYLMGVPEGADLMETPVSPPELHYFYLKGKSKLNGDGSLEGEFTIDAERQEDASVRRMFTSNYRSNWETALEKELLAVFPQARITSQDYGDPVNYLEKPLHITVKYKIPGYAVVTGNEIIVTPLAVSGIFKRAMSHLYINTDIDKRRYNFRDRCTKYIELSETMELPYEVTPLFIPGTAASSGSAASFKGGYFIDGKTLQVSETLKFKKRIYEPGDWDSFRDAVLNQKKIIDNPVILSIEK